VEQNKMSFSNLAVVFAPTMIRPMEENLTRMMTDAKLVSIGMIMLMEEYEYLFDVCALFSPLPILSLLFSLISPLFSFVKT
jgi:hypothetical protein